MGEGLTFNAKPNDARRAVSRVTACLHTHTHLSCSHSLAQPDTQLLLEALQLRKNGAVAAHRTAVMMLSQMSSTCTEPAIFQFAHAIRSSKFLRDDGDLIGSTACKLVLGATTYLIPPNRAMLIFNKIMSPTD